MNSGSRADEEFKRTSGKERKNGQYGYTEYLGEEVCGWVLVVEGASKAHLEIYSRNHMRW